MSPTTRTPFGERSLLTTTPDPVTAEAPPFDLTGAMAARPFAPTGFAPGTVGVVTGELLRYAAFWRSLLALQTPPGTGRPLPASGLDLPTNRNKLVEVMHGDWLFSLDDDVVLLPTTLMRLLAVLERGEYAMVAAFALQRSPPFPSLVFLEDATGPVPRPPMWVPDGRRGVMEIAACGLPAVLIHRRVFDALEPPFFRVGQVDPDHYHEDVEFCHRVRAAGFRIAVDLDTPVGHVVPMALWPARNQDDAPCAVLASGGGQVVPVDTASLHANPMHNPALIGL